MKKIGLLFVLFVSLISCSNDSDNKTKTADTNYYGKWTNVIDAKDINNPYVWREYYIFNEDKTFVKSRTDKGVTTTASGTFELFTSEGRPNFRLTYSVSSNMILNCSGQGSLGELLYLYNGHLENAAIMCDGGSTYEKAK